MEQVNVHEAKTHLSRLLARVAQGEVITIARGGKPVARLVPVEDAWTARVPGRDVGKGWVSDDFDEPLPDDVLNLFYG